MTREAEVQESAAHARGHGRIEPYTWKAIAAVAATALAQIAAEFRRIADEMERRSTG